MKKESFSRRNFLTTAGKTAMAATLIGPAIVSQLSASSRSLPVPMDPIKLDLTNPNYSELKMVGGAKKITNPLDAKKPIIVTRVSENSYAAFSSKCTHFGCEVDLPQKNIITCPCHKSTFDLTGKVTHGPAQKDLPAFSVTLEGTTLMIKDATA